MSAAERLAAMDLLWDSLLRDGADLPSPHWPNRPQGAAISESPC